MTEVNAVAEQPVSPCCGGPAPKETEACCVRDAEAKAAGDTGCGCGAPQGTQASQASSCCS